MEINVENGRLYLPAEDETKPSERTAIHPETNSEQVIMDDDGTNLKEFLGEQIVIGSQDPKKKCLWLQVTATRV